MILQTSYSDQMKTMMTLVGTVDLENGQKCSSLDQARCGYRKFLSSLGQREIETTSCEISFITREDDAAKLRQYFSNDSLLDDKQQASVIETSQDGEVNEKKNRIRQALQELSLYSPDYAAIFRTVITDIFILPSRVAKGGSTSQAIGLIWANPKTAYTTADIVEMLIHEFTHHTMFLDELRYKHYAYDMVMDRSTWAQSAILNVSRPLDKVLHSIVVATEVLLFRKYHLGHPANPRVHPPTDLMIEQLDEAILSTESSITSKDFVFHERAVDLLRNARRIFENELLPLRRNLTHNYRRAS